MHERLTNFSSSRSLERLRVQQSTRLSADVEIARGQPAATPRPMTFSGWLEVRTQRAGTLAGAALAICLCMPIPCVYTRPRPVSRNIMCTVECLNTINLSWKPCNIYTRANDAIESTHRRVPRLFQRFAFSLIIILWENPKSNTSVFHIPIRAKANVSLFPRAIAQFEVHIARFVETMISRTIDISAFRLSRCN